MTNETGPTARWNPQEALARSIVRWIAGIQRRPRLTLLVVLVLVALSAAASWRRLGIDSDVNAMISSDEPFRVREVAFQRSFPTGVESILVVVHADDPTTARHTAEALASRLQESREHFRRVYLPWGGAFFQRNALLYLSSAELEDLADRLAAVQPVLAAVTRSPDAAGVFGMLRRALELRRRGVDLGIDLAPILARLGDALEGHLAGRRTPDPWADAGLLAGIAGLDEQTQVITLEPKLDYADLLAAQPALDAIHTAVRELGLDRAPGVRVRITGDPILNYEEMRALETQGVLVFVASLALVSLLLLFAFRSLRLALAVIANLVAGVVVASGVAALAIGDLNQLSVAFSVLVVGIGDFGIQLLLRAEEISAPGAPLHLSLPEAGRLTGPALVVSALATSSGFFAFSPTKFLGVAQLGIITGVGILVSFALSLTIPPALLSLGMPVAARSAPRPGANLRWLQGLPERWPRALCLGAAALAVLSAALLPRLRFDYNAVDLRDPRAESVQAFDELLRSARTSPWTIDLVEPDLAAADAAVGRIRALPEVAEATTLTDYVPEDQSAKLETIAALASFLPPQAPAAPPAARGAVGAALADLRKELALAGHDPELARQVPRLSALLDRVASRGGPARALDAALLGSLPSQLAELRESLEPGPVALDDLPPEIRERMLARDGRARIEVAPRASLDQGSALARFVDAVQGLAPDATGPALVMVEWGRLASRAMEEALGGAAACIALLLFALWRRPADVALALGPLLLAALYTGAVMVLGGVEFNLANIVVVPMLMGIGVDGGIHLVNRMRRGAPREGLLGTATARAVVYSALATLASFSTLSFAPHRGMASLGQLLTLGVAVILLCYVIVLPAGIGWARQRGSPT